MNRMSTGVRLKQVVWWRIPGLGRSPEKEMVTHSSILAWRIPWTEKPGRLQSTGSKRVGHEIGRAHV